MRSGQGSSAINTIGILVLVVLVVVALAVFFFSGLSKQGGILGQTSNHTVGGLNEKLDTNMQCLPPPHCCDSAQATTDKDNNPCCNDCSVCPNMQGCP